MARRRRIAGLAPAASVVAAIVAVSFVASAQADPVMAQEAAAALGRHRAASGVPPLDGDPERGAQAHAAYLSRNVGRPEVAGLRVHEEDASLPGATPEGAAAARRSHVAAGAESPTWMIDGLVGAPLHRHALMDPRLVRIGMGRAGEGTGADPFQWVVDLSSRDRAWVGPPVAIAYPGPGQMHVPVRFPDGETPDPRAAVAGPAAAIAGMGYPVTLSFFGCRPTAVGARLAIVGDAALDGTVAATGDVDVPTHLLVPGTTIRTDGGDRDVEPVLFFARDVLRPQSAYRATVTATCGALGTATYEWTFATRPHLRGADVSVAVAAPGPDGWQEVTLVAEAGGIAAPARISEVAAAFTTRDARTGPGPAVGGAPEIDLAQAKADPDGRMRLRVNLRGATFADVTATITDEGATVAVPFTVRPLASGATKVVIPATAPFPRLLDARPSWVPELPAKDGG